MKRLLDLILGKSQRTNRLVPRSKTRWQNRGRRLQLESLENRRVFDATFGSVIGIGNGETRSAALDVAADATGNRYVAGYFSGVVDFDPGLVHESDVDILMSRGTTDSYVAKYGPDDSLLWVRRMGGDSIQDETAPPNLKLDKASKVEVDANGNVYVVGGFAGSSDFGTTTLTTNGDGDVFVAKLNSSGVFQWTKRWGGTQNDGANGVDIDQAGNIFVTAGSGAGDFAILKYSSSGALSWDQRLGTSVFAPFGNAMAVDSSGNVFVTGSFQGTVDFDPGVKSKLVTATSTGHLSAFVLKLTSQGKFGWVDTFQGGSSSLGGALTIDSSNNVVVGGVYQGAVDFNPGSGVTTIGARGAYVAKLTNAGSLVWAKSFDINLYSTSYEFATIRDFATDAAGSIYAVGQFNGSIDLNPSASGVAAKTTNGDMDIFLVKLTSAGAYQWSESFGGVGYEYATMALDGQNNIHLAGYFQSTVDFDAGAGDSSLSTNGTSVKGFLKKLRQV